MITTPGAHKAARSRSRSPRPSFWMRQDLKKQTPVTAESRGASTELLDASRSKPMQPRRVGGVTVETSIWGDCRLPPPRPEPRRETIWLVAPPEIHSKQEGRRRMNAQLTTHPRHKASMKPPTAASLFFLLAARASGAWQQRLSPQPNARAPLLRRCVAAPPHLRVG